jgi:thioredoxin
LNTDPFAVIITAGGSVMHRNRYTGYLRRIAAATAALAALFIIAAYSSPAYAGGVVVADDNSYNNEVVQSKLPVILEFSASWCGWCKKMAPTMDQMAKELSGKVKVVSMDIDTATATKSRFKVRSVPTFFYLEGGNVKGQVLGARQKEDLLSALGVPEEYWKK